MEIIIDVPDVLFSEMGCRLLLYQDFESFAGFIVDVAFQDNPVKAKEALLKADKRTMGQLLKALRKLCTIEATFDSVLKRVLESRNIFVHNFSIQYDLRSNSGQEEALKFLDTSLSDLEEATAVMKGALIVFGKDTGLLTKEYEDEWRKHGDFVNLEKNHVPKVNNIFSK